MLVVGESDSEAGEVEAEEGHRVFPRETTPATSEEQGGDFEK